MSRLITALGLLLVSSVLFAQALDTIPIKNPSFDDFELGGPVVSWTDCTARGETSFDVLESGENYFDGTEESFEGPYIVSLVVRDNETSEGMSQHLQHPLLAGKIYQISVILRRPKTYNSYSRVTGEKVSYTEPIILDLYGGNGPCAVDELLAYTEPVTEFEWVQFDFVLEPTDDYSYLTLRAQYSGDTFYNGAILIDYLSEITELE